MARLLSSVQFGSILAYSPYGTTESCQRMKRARAGIKGGDQGIYRRAAEVIREQVESGVLSSFFGPDVALVPVPRSAPLVPGALWPAHEIVTAMVAEGLGRYLPTLKRTVAVPKSHLAPQGERTTAPRHLETIAAESPEPLLEHPALITVVDDVVSRGRTLLAAASRVATAYPSAQVRAFAVLRTIGWGQPVDVEHIPDARAGTISWSGTDVEREP